MRARERKREREREGERERESERERGRLVSVRGRVKFFYRLEATNYERDNGSQL